MGRRATGTVEPRTSSIRLKFTRNGARCVEVLDLDPTPANIKAAERLMARIAGAIQAGVYRRSDFFEDEDNEGDAGDMPTTFAAYAKAWLPTASIAKSTRRAYAGAFKNTWDPAFGKVELVDLRQSHIRKAIAARKDHVTGAHLNNHLSALRECLNAAIGDKLIKDSPANGIKNLKVQRPEPDPFEVVEREQILTYMHDRYPEQIWNYYVVAFHTGLRPSEQIALEPGDVDWKKRKLRVQRSIVEQEEKSTKTSRVRYVDLSDDALAALTRQKKHTFFKGKKLFENPVTNQPWRDEHSQRVVYFVPALKALGLRHRDAYQTRHTFATTLLMGHVNPAYIAKQLGHASLAMLFQTYGRWIDDADGGAEADKLRIVLGRNGGPALNEEEAV